MAGIVRRAWVGTDVVHAASCAQAIEGIRARSPCGFYALTIGTLLGARAVRIRYTLGRRIVQTNAVIAACFPLTAARFTTRRVTLVFDADTVIETI